MSRDFFIILGCIFVFVLLIVLLMVAYEGSGVVMFPTPLPPSF